jgi:hypothetical protein
VRLVVGIGIGDAREQVLVVFAGEQVAIVERVLAEQRQQRIARGVGDDREAPRVDRVRILGRLFGGSRNRSRRVRDIAPIISATLTSPLTSSAVPLSLLSLIVIAGRSPASLSRGAGWPAVCTGANSKPAASS